MVTGPRTVVVTGASGGVGRGIALACGQAGWRVWIAARRAEQGEAVAAEVTAAGGDGRFVRCDIGTPADVAAAVATVAAAGPLHGAVHNATSSLSPIPSAMTDLRPAQLADHIAVALRGFLLLARAVHPLLVTTHGSLVVTTSEAGFEGKKLLSAYSTVKAAQRGLARVLAREWGPDGVRVNCVAPLAATPAMTEAFEKEPAMEARINSRVPLGRVGSATDDVGPVVRFLLSEDARYLTGQTIMADGGSCQVT